MADDVRVGHAAKLVREDDGASPRPKHLPRAWPPYRQALVMDDHERRVVLRLRKIDAKPVAGIALHGLTRCR